MDNNKNRKDTEKITSISASESSFDIFFGSASGILNECELQKLKDLREESVNFTSDELIRILSGDEE